MIKVLKFGGASIKDSKRIENVFSIIDKYKNHKIIIVFSAIANITNLLEDLVDLYINKDAEVKSKLLEIKKIHFDILDNLFNENDDVYVKINNVFDEIDLILNIKAHKNFSFNYDQIVSKGELLSSIILSDYLNLKKINNFSRKLFLINEKRKLIEQNIFNEAIEQIKDQENKKFIIVYKENWHQGVLGIVASKIVALYNKPTFVFSFINNIGSGSGRSIDQIDIGNIVLELKANDLIEDGGGHKMAVGLKINKKKLDKIDKFLAPKTLVA